MLATCLRAAAAEPATSLAADFSDRIARLEAEVAELQSSVPPTPRSVDFSPRLWALYSTGWYGGAEVTILEPFMSGSPAVFPLDPSAGSLIDQRFLAGVRYQVGWANEDGLGVRGRYWSYFQYFTYAAPNAPNQLGIDLQAADLEATIAHRLGRWDALLAAGARYGKLGYVNNAASIFGVGTATFEGVGPTVAVEGRRRLGGSAFSFYGNVRGSALFGTIANKSLFTSMPASNIGGEVMGVAENQLGIAWDRVTEGGLVIEARACWETQYWMNSTLSDDVYG
ncbi:MAG: Lpg1974 family pore-forming outer membrane protein, partial [Planctomycetia bacterium]